MDHFKNYHQSLESPATRLLQIVPDDDADLAFVTRALVVDASGYVQVVTAGGDTGRVFVVAGVPFPLRATKVMASGTTATGIVGLA